MEDFKIFEKIEDEMDGAKKYLREAMRQKSRDRELAEAYYGIAKQEQAHAEALRNQAQRIIKAHPEYQGMAHVHDYLNHKMTDWQTTLKDMMTDYDRR